jgi:hypothetical protein
VKCLVVVVFAVQRIATRDTLERAITDRIFDPAFACLA